MARKRSDNQISSDVKRIARRFSMTIAAKLVLMLIVTVVVGATLLFGPTIERALKLDRHLTDIKDYDGAYDIGAVVADGELKVHFVDVGQGDCTIVELPDGKTMLIDGGENKTAVKDAILDYIDTRLPQDFEYFDYAVLTHTDSDHCGSLAAVLQAYPARTVYRPNVLSDYKDFVDPGLEKLKRSTDPNEKFWTPDMPIKNELNDAETAAVVAGIQKKNTAAYKKFVEAAYRSNDEFTPNVLVSDGRPDQSLLGASADSNQVRPEDKATQNIKGDDYDVKFWGPVEPKYNDWNNYSNILTIEYQNKKILLSGDAEKEEEANFVALYKNHADLFDVDVVKLGHHGSKTSSSEAFLKLVISEENRKNVVAIASCGLDNKYGHPSPETVSRLETLYGDGIGEILRTDINGNIALSVKAGSITGGGESGSELTFAGTRTGVVKDPPIDWWHIAVTIEAAAFILIFFIVKTKKKRSASDAAVSVRIPSASGGSGSKKTSRKKTSTKGNSSKRGR